MGKKSSDPDPRLAENVQRLGDIAQEDWDWFKNTYMPEATQQQGKISDTSDQILQKYLSTLIPGQENAYAQGQDAANQTTQTALGQMNTAGQTGDQIYKTWNDSYAPIYGQIASEAAAKGGQADQDYQSMLARGDVTQAFANSDAQMQRYLAQYGMSPTSGAAIAGARGAKINEAAQQAAAQTAARQAAANLGWTYRQQAAQVGQGLLSAGNQAYETSQNSGINAINAQQGAANIGKSLQDTYGNALSVATAPLQSANSIGQTVATGAGAATGAANGAAGQANAQYQTSQNAASANAANTSSTIGTGVAVAGTVAAAVI